nr:hypothetical protein [Tanacetum cinerariifolium]
MELPSKYDLLSFIKELGYSGKCDMLSTIRTEQMHQPWRTFAAIINRKVKPKKSRKFKKPPSPRLKTIPSSPKEHTEKGKLKDTSEGTGVKPGVPDVSKEDSFDSESKSWGDNEEESDDDNDEDKNDDDNEEDDSDNIDGDNDDSGNNNEGNDDEGSNEDSDQTDSDDDENPFSLRKTVKKKNNMRSLCLLQSGTNLKMMIRCMKKKTMMSQRSCMEI